MFYLLPYFLLKSLYFMKTLLTDTIYRMAFWPTIAQTITNLTYTYIMYTHGAVLVTLQYLHTVDS